LNVLATWNIGANQFPGYQRLFSVLLGNNPEASSWHCWSAIQRAAQSQPDPHSSQHSCSHWHDGGELLQQPARR